jgi:DNA replication protein DnaC
MEGNTMNKIGAAINNIMGQTSKNIPEQTQCKTCGKDHELVNFPHPITGETRYVLAACQCDVDRLEEEKLRSERIEKQNKIRRILRLSSTLEDIQKMTFDNLIVRKGYSKTIEKVKQAVKDFDQRGKRGLFIAGETGNGKTHITSAGANELLKQGYAVIFITEGDLLDRLNATKNFNNKESLYEIMNACLSADLLVWDDFMSSSRFTKDETDWIFQIVNGRERANRPIWYTTNLTAEEITNDQTAYKLDDKGRTWWRIQGNSDSIINFASNYRRAQKMAELTGKPVEDFE